MQWQSDTAVMFTGPENDPMNRAAGCTERVPVACQTGAFFLLPWRVTLTNDEMNSPLFFAWEPLATSRLRFLTSESQPNATNLVWANFFQIFLKKVLTSFCGLVILPMPTGTDERPTADGSEGETGGRVLR